MLIADQVAIAPCTDCVQAQRPTFQAKPCRTAGLPDGFAQKVTPRLRRLM